MLRIQRCVDILPYIFLGKQPYYDFIYAFNRAVVMTKNNLARSLELSDTGLCLRERIPPPADVAEEMPAIEIPAPLSPIPEPSPQVAGPSNPARKQLNVSKSKILTFKNVNMLYSWYFLKMYCLV